MFLIDDVLLSPMRSFLFLFRENDDTAQQEGANEAESTRIELGELHMMIEEEFDAKEVELLRLLDEKIAAETAALDEMERVETD